MKQQLEDIQGRALAALDAATSPAALEELRVKLLGKKGGAYRRPEADGQALPGGAACDGPAGQHRPGRIEARLERRKSAIHAAALEARLAAEAVDVTIPGTPVSLGHQHPMNQVLQEIKDIFVGMGYTVVDGPEVELAEYNFTKLNIQEGHPSRDRSDTFYFTDDDSLLLRTQTSPMQVRDHGAHAAPHPHCRAPGRVYRKDEADATHSPMFHQVEGLVVDEGVTMGDLKGTLETLMKRLYGEDAVMRFRPHHFPYRAQLRDGHAVPQMPWHW